MTEEAVPVERVALSQVCALNDRGGGSFGADIHPEWSIGGKPNGGYLLAMLGQAAASMSEHRHVLAAAAHFLRPPDPGPVVIEAELLRGGRSASQLRTRMCQKGQDCVEALITVSEFDAGALPYWQAGLPEAGNSSLEECTRLISRTPDGRRVAIMDQVEVRLEPGSSGFIRGSPTGRGELRGWLALPKGEAFDPASLLFAVDAFPPATFDIEFSGLVPTLELTAYVRALPAPRAGACAATCTPHRWRSLR